MVSALCPPILHPYLLSPWESSITGNSSPSQVQGMFNHQLWGEENAWLQGLPIARV